MPTADELRAALGVAELEEELAAAKDDPDADGYRDLKMRLRAARQDYRETHRSPADAVGDGVAQPATIDATAAVKES